MWISPKVVDWFTHLQDAAEVNSDVAKVALQDMREQLAVLRSERDALRSQLTISQTHFDWLRMRVNQLEHERAILINKVHGIDVGSPMIAKVQPPPPDLHELQFSFEDVGDDIAKQLGLELPTPKH